MTHGDDPQDDRAAWFARVVEREARAWFTDIAAATRLLTRMPPFFKRRASVPEAGDWLEPGPIGRAVRAFPVVGLVIGLGAGIGYALMQGIGLPTPIAAIVALGVSALLTGALHEDGLADTADGFGGGAEHDDKLSIMRDSRIGAYGVLALVLVLGAKLGALIDLDSIGVVMAGLIASSATSRALLPALMRWSPAARSDGLAASAGQPPSNAVFTGLGLAVLISLILLSWSGLVACIIAAIGAYGMALLAKRQVGGYTGDVLGATQQVADLLFLLALAAIR